jgi:nitroreductase
MLRRIKAKVFALIFWQTSLGEIFNKIYDLRIFYASSFINNKFNSKESNIAFLTKQYHIVEKGLALPNPRLGFGVEKIKLLIEETEKYILRYGNDSLTLAIKNCLSEYLVFNAATNTKLETEYRSRIENFIAKEDNLKLGGTAIVKNEDLRKITAIDFKSFVKSRFSVRDFSTEELEISKIQEAIDIAKHAPSVCNRQSWKAHVFKNKEEILALLKLQGGNNGFSESINKLIIITTDARAFTKMESNQIFIDGGLFSMNVVLALHSLNIGACCLNTCFPYTVEKQVKRIGSICPNERLIMMMGVGNLKAEYKVAISQKKNITELIQIH